MTDAIFESKDRKKMTNLSFLILHLQTASILRKMVWYLKKPQVRVFLGGFRAISAFFMNIDKHVTCLLPDLLTKEYHIEKTPVTTITYWKDLYNYNYLPELFCHSAW